MISLNELISKAISIPFGIKCFLENEVLIVKGDVGENILIFGNCFKIEDGSLVVTHGEKKYLHTYLALVKNAFVGSSKGFSKIVNLHGVGYKVEKKGGVLEFSLGYSHKINIIIPEWIDCEVKSITQILLKSASKQLLGDFVSKILKLRKPNPYKLKGVLKEGQFIRRKEGKKK